MGIEANSKPWFISKIISPSPKQTVQNSDTSSGVASGKGSPKKLHLGMKKTTLQRIYLFIYLSTLFEFGVNPSSYLHKETWLIEAK